MTEKRLRRPPAFQCYASDFRSDPRVMLMSAAERGVLFSMLLACWVADEIPSNPKALARILSMDEGELGPALTGEVLSFFGTAVGDQAKLYSIELSEQMENLLNRQIERAQSGRKGGLSSRAKAAASTSPVVGKRSAGNSGPSSATSSARPADLSSASSSLSRAEPKQTESRPAFREQAPKIASVGQDEWLKGYKRGEIAGHGGNAEAYRKASRGE